MATTATADLSAWKAILARAKGFGSKRNLGVGVFGDAELADIARFHEYGTQNIPERSYLRSTMYEQRDATKRNLKRLAQAILTKGMSIEQAFGIVGSSLSNAVKRKIRSNIPPALALETLKRKGGKTIALIFTGRLLNAITWRRVP